MAFEMDDAEIAELRFHILDLMMDDAEDVEQLYLSANRDELLKGPPAAAEVCSTRDHR